MRLKGKSAIVTGGASGFGAGIVRKFAAEGAQVLIADLNIDLANELADELGENVRATKTNVTSRADVAAMGPDVIVTGSAVFDGKDVAGNLTFMIEAINHV